MSTAPALAGLDGPEAPAETASAGERILPRLGVLYTYESGERSALRGLTFARNHDVRSILDSGAWSVFNAGAVIDPRAHAQFVLDLVPTFTNTRFVGLDVIGDEETTYRNWMLQREMGAPVEPTIHFGAPPDFIDRYLSEGLAVNGQGETWINCGGMVMASSRPTWIRPTMAWIAAVRSRLPEHVKIHGLGMTTPAANDLIRLDSVDSTYWLVSLARNRVLPLFDPSRRRWSRIGMATATQEYRLESKATMAGIGPLLRSAYGTTPREVWEMDDTARLFLSIRSHAHFADAYRARHRHPSSPVVYLAGAPGSETAQSSVLMPEIARWADVGADLYAPT